MKYTWERLANISICICRDGLAIRFEELYKFVRSRHIMAQVQPKLRNHLLIVAVLGFAWREVAESSMI